MGDPYSNTIFEGAPPVDFSGGASFDLGLNDIPVADAAGTGNPGMPGGLFSSTGSFNTFMGGLGDLAQSATDFMAAGSYREAAKAYDTAAAETGWMQPVQNYEIGIKTQAVVGAQRGLAAGAGLANTGTVSTLERSATAQGGLAKATSEIGAEEKEQGYEFQAKEANKEAEASTMGGILGGVLGVVGILGGIF